MFRTLLMAVALAVSALMLPTVIAAEPAAPAVQWVPQDAVIALEVTQPKALLDLICDPKTGAAITALPVYKKLASQPKSREFFAGIAFLEARLGTDWRAAVHKLLDGGVVLSVHPHEGVLLIADADDPKLLEELHNVLVAIAKAEATKSGQPDRVVSKQYEGVAAWSFGGNEAHAIVGNRLLVTNKPALLKAALDLRAKPGAQNLAAVPGYQAAKKAAGPGAAAVLFANMEVLKQLPQLQTALKQNENPLGALLFAAVADALRGASWLGLGLDVQEKTLTLKAAVDNKSAAPSKQAAFTVPSQPGEGVLPNLSVPRQIAGLSFYRDLHGFYAAKDELFPERTSGLIFFENMMGIFFSGRDLTEEVLAETRPETRFVVAEQTYDSPAGTPEIQIPAFGVIFRLRQPEQSAKVAEEAWQKAVGLINITQGQKALPGLIIDRETHGDTQFTVAYYSSAGRKEESSKDVRLNFRPALACVGDYLVLTSTDGLAKDLIDALHKELAGSVQAMRETHSLIKVDGARLASVLQANRETMVRQDMVKKGKTQEQSQNDFDWFVTLLRQLGQATLDVGTAAGRHQASLEVKLNLPR